MNVRVPCGRTLGHGESCTEGYLCEQCTEIVRLRATDKPITGGTAWNLHEAATEVHRLQRDLAACDEAGKRIGAALTSAAILINALLDELIHSSRAADRPLPLQLIAAKGSFDLQIQRLFKTMEPKAEEHKP